MTFSWDSGDLKEFQTGGPSASATPYLIVNAEKSPSPASPLRGQKNRGAGKPAGSFEEAQVGGLPSNLGEQRRPLERRPPRDWAERELRWVSGKPRG